MLIQQAACTIHASRTPMENFQDGSAIMKFEIRADLKEALSKQLYYLGFTKEKLFPDLYHLAKEISRKFCNGKSVSSSEAEEE